MPANPAGDPAAAEKPIKDVRWPYQLNVTVHRRKPVFRIKFDNTELAVDEELAKNIFGWKLKWKWFYFLNDNLPGPFI